MQLPWQQPLLSLQPSQAQSRPSAWRSTVGDLRIVRFAATASITSGGKRRVVEALAEARALRVRSASYSAPQKSATSSMPLKRSLYQAR